MRKDRDICCPLCNDKKIKLTDLTRTIDGYTSARFYCEKCKKAMTITGQLVSTTENVKIRQAERGDERMNCNRKTKGRVCPHCGFPSMFDFGSFRDRKVLVCISCGKSGERKDGYNYPTKSCYVAQAIHHSKTEGIIEYRKKIEKLINNVFVRWQKGVCQQWATDLLDLIERVK